jgi:hypothetical protein
MTGTITAGAIDKSLWISETKVEARTTSNVVTPKSLGGYVFSTSPAHTDMVLTSWDQKRHAISGLRLRSVL